jgi:hypothetical protein
VTDYSLKRTYKGQVLVMPPDREPLQGEWLTSKDNKRYFRPHQKDAMAYGRTSSAGEHLKGGGDGLANWKAAMAAIGMVVSNSARSEVANLVNEYDGDPYYAGDDGGWRSGKRRLLDAVELACEIAGSSTASSRGTEFHKLGELVNKGKKPTVIQPHLASHLVHYQQMVAPITFLAQEILIVNDDIQRAGSIDYLMQLPPGLTTPDGEVHERNLVCVGDLKTGRWDVDYPAGLSAQLAGYGLGHRYNQETNERSPLHEHASKKWGVLVHYPLVEPDATVKFYWVDLETGIRAARLNNQLDAMIKFYKSEKGKPIRFEVQ